MVDKYKRLLMIVYNSYEHVGIDYIFIEVTQKTPYSLLK